MTGMFQRVLVIPVAVALVGCSAIARGESTYRSDLEAVLTANNSEEMNSLGVGLSDEAIGCMAAASLGGFSDHELQEAGVTTANVVERLRDLNERLDEDRDGPRIASVIENHWNCFDREDFVALNKADQISEEVSHCLIDTIGLQALRNYSISQSIAEEAGGDPPDSTEITAAAESCVGGGAD